MKEGKSTHISTIIQQFLGNRFSKGTEEDIQQWLLEDSYSEEKEKSSLDYWDTLNAEPDKKTYDALKRVNVKTGFSSPKLTIPFYSRILRVAAFIIPTLILAGGTYYFSQREQMTQFVTASGETKQIMLPDSSEVWLNSGSMIEYPEKFKKNKRIIHLEGEAYFSVKKDTSKPFVVETSSLFIKVLGTKFNVKAYRNDNKIVATLNSGKIEVETVSKQSRILTPNEQLTYNKQTSDVSVTNIAVEDAPSWINGQLIFTNASFDEILKTLERRFNVSFNTDNATLSKETYTIKFLKNDSLEQILNVLEDVIGGFNYQKEGSNIKIVGKDI